jgi:hypothetical protein
MKTINTKTVKQVLKKLGFKPVPGNASGHSLWEDGLGRFGQVLRKKEIGIVFSL